MDSGEAEAVLVINVDNIVAAGKSAGIVDELESGLSSRYMNDKYNGI